MRRRLLVLMTCVSVAGGVAPSAAAATAPAAPARATATPAPGAPAPEAAQGMVVTGDQEAPLVLYILPWQPPRMGEAPAVDAQPLLPRVLDSVGSVLDGPLNRPEPAAIRPPAKTGAAGGK